MNNKILLAILIFVSIIAVGSVNAFDLDSMLSTDSTTVNISGIEFNVPENYTEDKDYEIINETEKEQGITYTMNGKTFYNLDTENIVAIIVSENENINITYDFISTLDGDKKNN